MDEKDRQTKAVDEYIRKFPEPVQRKLKVMRKVIRTMAPMATERISYGMPAFFLDRNLIYYAGYSKHIGIYPGTKAVETLKNQLSGCKYAKGSIQFPNDKPLPVGLIRKIVSFRLDKISKTGKGTSRKNRRNKGAEQSDDDDCYP